HGFIRQPGVEQIVRLLTGEYFHPVNLALAAVGLRDGCVHDANRRTPDVRAGAVAVEEREDGVIRNGELAVVDGDFLALRGHSEFDRGRHRYSEKIQQKGKIAGGGMIADGPCFAAALRNWSAANRSKSRGQRQFDMHDVSTSNS